MNNFEIRMNPASISTDTDGKMYCEGLVNGTESWSHELGVHRKYVEKVKKGVFKKALERAKRIDFLVEHDASKLLATTENGSLQLYEDEEGLKMRAEICPTSYGKDMYELMKSGLIKHMSFGFKALKDSWQKRTNGLYERTIEDLMLAEVSVVRNPAYSMSGISARNITVVEDVEIPSNVEEIKEETMKEEIKEQIVEETIEEVVEEVPVEEQVEEVQEVHEEEVQEVTETVEQRAYFVPIYSKEKAINSCLDLITQSTELISYCNEHGTDTSIVPALQSTIKSVTDYMVSLTDVEVKEETLGEVVAEVVEQVVDSMVDEVRSSEKEEVQSALTEEKEVVEAVEDTEEKAEEVEEEVVENEDTTNTEKEEESTIDLSKYRQLIKEEIKL